MIDGDLLEIGGTRTRLFGIDAPERGHGCQAGGELWICGGLARSFEPPAGLRCRSAEVSAVVRWSREASEPQYRDSVRCDAWEVLVPELVYRL